MYSNSTLTLLEHSACMQLHKVYSYFIVFYYYYNNGSFDAVFVEEKSTRLATVYTVNKLEAA